MADTEKIDELHSMKEQLKQADIQKQKDEKAVSEQASVASSSASEASKAESTKQSAAAAKEKPEKEAKAEKTRKVVSERIATVPLVRAYRASMSNRARMAMSILRTHVQKHMKALEVQVKISPLLSNEINSRGARTPPRSLKVIMRKFDDGTVGVEPAVMPAPTKAEPKIKPPKKSTPKAQAKPKAAPTAAAPIIKPAATKQPAAQPVKQPVKQVAAAAPAPK